MRKFEELIKKMEQDEAIFIDPNWNKITGSPEASILFSKMICLWEENNRKPFWKFKQPCKHPLYETEQSWCEVLGFTRKEFDDARSNIAIRLNKYNKDEPHDKFVEYWVYAGITFYRVNEENIKKRGLNLEEVKKIATKKQ